MPRLSFTPFTLAAVSMWLQACGGMPPSADESRQATRGAMATKTETFEVNRPVREVAATLQQQAPECLDIAVGTVLRTFASQQNILTEYRATVVADGERAELQLQQLQKSAAVAPSKLSTSGAAVVVAEAIALPGNRTRMSSYLGNLYADPLPGDPESLRRLVERDTARWGQLIKTAGIEPE